MFVTHHQFAPAILLSFLVVTAGCEASRRSSPAGPTPIEVPAIAPPPAPSIESFLGVWRSASGAPARLATPSATATPTAVPELRGCRNFQWDVNSQSRTAISGALSVECADAITLSANATGELTSATSLALIVAGTANLPGVGACAFTLAGPGTLVDIDTLKIDYTGTTCLGPVAGSVTLIRDRLFPPPPAPVPPPPAPPASPTDPTPPPPPAPSIPCVSSDGWLIVQCIERAFPERLVAGVSHDQRVANMAFLRDRIIEAGRCGGLDLAWNLKRGVGPHSIDALAWRHANGFVDVVDIGAAYDDTSRPLELNWLVVAGPPGYDPYPHPGCS
ncbi:MAG: hypothetical protein IT183_10340 [Acidobacteria bacterium]|nr:hypothetical protein [Acidobacteriota bacterium]